jgi:UDP-N-acetylglucosamine 2-epimerase (non-hydrolysing)
VTHSNKLTIINIVGARPNFMKIAPLMAEYHKYSEILPILVHTGQHYDAEMSHLFFHQLGIPEPDINLQVGSGSQAVQTAEIMMRFEPLISEYNPDLVLVVGDVNSTLACSLVAAKLGVKVAHVEAGLRSFDRSMPEEINRIVTDALSDFLFVSEPSGIKNLKEEGVPDEKIFFVGNVMIDTLLKNLEKSNNSNILEELGLQPQEYALMTLHRPANVDAPVLLD